MDAARPALTDIERRTGKRQTGYKGPATATLRCKTWYGAIRPKNRVPCQPSQNAKAR